MHVLQDLSSNNYIIHHKYWSLLHAHTHNLHMQYSHTLSSLSPGPATFPRNPTTLRAAGADPTEVPLEHTNPEQIIFTEVCEFRIIMTKISGSIFHTVDYWLNKLKSH